MTARPPCMARHRAAMPWTISTPMLERAALIDAAHSGLYSVAELARRHGVSRKTAYKWLDRHRAEGDAALVERSHVAHSLPHRTSVAVEALVLEARRAHPTWGPRKLLAYLARRHDGVVLPAPSTVGAILKRTGRVTSRRRKRVVVHPGSAPLVTAAPGDVWCTELQGRVPPRLGAIRAGGRPYPLTVTDAHSRFLLCAHALPSTRQDGVFPIYDRLFREHGLPAAIRTDNGVPFATQAIAGLSRLSVWWMRLSIEHHRIEPGRPQQNGRHERMHGRAAARPTMKAEATKPPERTMAQQQERFDGWQRCFNEKRPHEALGGATPASVYTVSPRAMPVVLPEPTYPGHFEVRWVSSCGTIRFKKHQLFVSVALKHEHVALEETGDGVWSLYFCDVLLGRLDERDYVLRP